MINDFGSDHDGTPSNRDGRISLFLARNGYRMADAIPLAQDASFRRYLRIRGERGAVLMDAPPPEAIGPFLQIADHLRAIGLSVPIILDADEGDGLLLEEDFGDDLLSALLDKGQPPIPLLEAAVDALLVMHRNPVSSRAPSLSSLVLPRWTIPQMVETALGTLFDWWWPARYGQPAPDDARRDVATALETMLAPVAEGPQTLVHRDYFAGNLLWLPDRHDAARIGVIDFQSAAIGHPAYDLVSLLQDVRRDIPPSVQRHALARYLAGWPDLDATQFRDAFDACAAQRHLRVACQWVRLALRDKRPQYLAFGPRTWRLLAEALLRPAAAPLAAALERWLPAADRGNPPDIEYLGLQT
jgi:N-acetylmuramate 1-kinase